MERYTITINVGFLWYSLMREELEKCQQEYPSLEWKKGRGWLDKNFYVSGPLEIIRKLFFRFGSWSSPIKEVKIG